MMKIHVVRKGDTLYDIAQKYGVDLDVLIAANPQIEDPDVLMIGQKIRIPSKGVAEPAARQAEPDGEAAAAAGGETKAVAAAGDTDGEGRRGGHHDDWNDWNNWNNHYDHDHGDGFFRYTVRPGDTLWEIAHRFGLSLQELVAANPQIENPDLIRPGDVIRIPRKKASWPSYYPPYGPMAPYPPHPMHPGHAGFGWGFYWSFVPPKDEGGAERPGQGHRGPWTPFTVWVPYEYSCPFYTDTMPGSYGYVPALPYGMDACPQQMGRGGEEQDEQAGA